MKVYRKLTQSEIDILVSQMCSSSDWQQVEVAEDFSTEYIRNARFAEIHSNYYDYEWKWAYRVIEEYYDVDLQKITADKLCELVGRWKSSVIGLDNLVYDDARKEFSLSSMTSFGADGDEQVRKEDFMQVRGSFFESNPFVMSVKDHIRVKSELGDRVLERLQSL